MIYVYLSEIEGDANTPNISPAVHNIHSIYSVINDNTMSRYMSHLMSVPYNTIRSIIIFLK